MRGRPHTNVFRLKQADTSVRRPPNLELRRIVALARHRIWRSNDKLQETLILRRFGPPDPDHSLILGAELAMAVIGRKYPEKSNQRPFYLRGISPVHREASMFLRWVRNEVKMNMTHRRGTKPDAEKIYKTALSLVVARKLTQPKGGNSRVRPSAKEISQVWYVLFHENEPHESIRSRLDLTGELCRKFDKDMIDVDLFSSSGRPVEFGKAGRAVEAAKKAKLRNRN